MQKTNAEEMSKKEIDNLTIKIGKKINEITDKAIAEANALLGVYGLACKMQIVIDGADKIAQLKQETPASAAINKGKEKRNKSTR